MSHLCPHSFRPVTTPSGTTAETRTAFGEPLRFIVICVMSGTFPYTYRGFYMTVNCWVFEDRHVIVMVSVMEK